MERQLTELVGRLGKVFGDRLVSVILYGSAASGERHEGYSDYNVFCVLAAVTPRELAEAEPVVHWWREQGSPAPLMMSEDETRHSADCFPIEFHDMRERRRVLHGRDVIAELEIDGRYYRAVLEHELRSKLIRLRQKAAGVMAERPLLLRLMADSAGTFLVLGRHALRLAGQAAPAAKRDAADALERHFGAAAEPFHKLLDIREGKSKPGAVDAGGLFARYLDSVSRLVEAVNRIAS